MQQRIRRNIGILVAIATTAIFVSTGTAGAAWVAPTADPGAPATFVQEVLESGVLDDTPAEWVPQGTLVAQSGFDPQVDGFNFMNYSDGAEAFPNLANTVFFDVPFEDPINLTADDMRIMFGNQACTNRVGPCIPTLEAEATREMFNEGMDGGHCFGIAGTVSQIFDRTIGLPSIGSAFRPPYRTPWSSTMTRTIARNMAHQYVNDLDGYTLTPTQAVNALRKNLAPGAAPYVLGLYETPPAQGGHAITPTALYYRGNGIYDIAVWDNNFPGRTRAVHIDTTANDGDGSMSYLMFTNPGAPPTMSSGDFALIPSTDLLGQQPCPFCDSAAGTTVSVDAVEVDADETVAASIVGLDGKPIPGLNEFPAFDPPNDGMQTFPMWNVPTGVGFRVVLSTKGAQSAVTTAVTAQTGDGTWIASNLVIRKNSIDVVTMQPKTESMMFTSTSGTNPTLAIIDSADHYDTGTTYQVEMRNVHLDARRQVTLDLDFVNDAAILRTNQKSTNRVSLAATMENATTESTLYAWSYAPAKGLELVVDFSEWTAAAPTGLAGWLANESGERNNLTWRARVISPNSVGAAFRSFAMGEFAYK